jgi:hypothetical protein
MANLTLAIDDDLLRAARIKAVQEGTSVNEICREAIARYAQPAQRDGEDFMAQLRVLAARNIVPRTPGAAPEPLPSRNDMMEEALAERMPTLMARLAKK